MKCVHFHLGAVKATICASSGFHTELVDERQRTVMASANTNLS